jgi:hypothetical protein
MELGVRRLQLRQTGLRNRHRHSRDQQPSWLFDLLDFLDRADLQTGASTSLLSASLRNCVATDGIDASAFA